MFRIVDAEDEDVAVTFRSGADSGEERGGSFLGRFLLYSGGVDYAGALGFRHVGRLLLFEGDLRIKENGAYEIGKKVVRGIVSLGMQL